MKRNLSIFLAVSVALVFLFSCSGIIDKGPSNEQTKQIFSGYFKKSIPLNWAGSLMGGKLQSIEFLEINRGKSIKSMNGGRLPEVYAARCEDCWPVTMHVKGVAMANMIFSRQKHPFEDRASFNLCKGYDGGWLIDTGDMMMSM
jgi:hypothetical protein